MKIVEENQLKSVIFTAMKNRCILHGPVFVMFSKAFTKQLLWLGSLSDSFMSAWTHTWAPKCFNHQVTRCISWLLYVISTRVNQV